MIQSLAELKTRKETRLRVREASVHTQSVILERPNIYILPTKHGLMFGLMLAAMLVGAVNYNNSLGYAFTFLLGSIATVSILHTYRNMAALSLKAGKVAPTFAGGQASFEVLVTNAGRTARYGIILIVDGHPTRALDIRAGETMPIILKRKAERRGVMPLGQITVTTRYPLGLFYGWSHVHLGLEAVVYPRPGSKSIPPMNVRYDPDGAGDKGRGAGDFIGFREYSPGDSLRHVFWKAYAAGRPLMTKQFGGDYVEQLFFDWDDLPNMGTEARLSQICRWVLDAARRDERFGVSLPGVEIPIHSGERHKHRCLEVLARF